MNSLPHSKKSAASSDKWKGKVKSTIRNRRQWDAHWVSESISRNKLQKLLRNVNKISSYTFHRSHQECPYVPITNREVQKKVRPFPTLLKILSSISEN